MSSWMRRWWRQRIAKSVTVLLCCCFLNVASSFQSIRYDLHYKPTRINNHDSRVYIRPSHVILKMDNSINDRRFGQDDDGDDRKDFFISSAAALEAKRKRKFRTKQSYDRQQQMSSSSSPHMNNRRKFSKIEKDNVQQYQSNSNSGDGGCKEAIQFIAFEASAILVDKIKEVTNNAFTINGDNTIIEDDDKGDGASVDTATVIIPDINDWQFSDTTREVTGIVFNHPTLDDGDYVRTSRIINYKSVTEGEIVVTKNGSKYMLGNPVLQIIPELNDWTVNINNGCIEGTVTNHPTIEDGLSISTSPLRDFSCDISSLVAGTVILTSNGSKYRLGMKLAVLENDDDNDMSNLIQSPAVKTVGDGRYALIEKQKGHPDQRSEVWVAYRTSLDDDGIMVPSGEAVAIKLTSRRDRVERENDNYMRITGSGLTRGMFVRRIEFLPNANDKSEQFADKCALVMELGKEDLKTYMTRKIRGLNQNELKQAAWSIAQCIQAVHASNLVWTDCKSENFVIVENNEQNFIVKGIDLESAMPVRGSPIDYTPESSPPEFAKAFLNGDGPDFILQKSYDIWSYGILLYELYDGIGFFDSGADPIKTTRLVLKTKYDLSDIGDIYLQDLIGQCLNIDPNKRPSITNIMFHPFFANPSSS